jgi:Rrf2 family protein
MTFSGFIGSPLILTTLVKISMVGSACSYRRCLLSLLGFPGMNFTSRSRYAIKILMDLAHHEGLPHVGRQGIADRHGIPTNYLDQIMLRLKRNRLVKSVRGRCGGYRLGKPSESITLWDIFTAVEDSIYPVKCLEKAESCDSHATCVSHDVWSEVFEAFKKPLVSLTLEQVARRWPEKDPGVLRGILECEGGKGQKRKDKVTNDGLSKARGLQSVVGT